MKEIAIKIETNVTLSVFTLLVGLVIASQYLVYGERVEHLKGVMTIIILVTYLWSEEGSTIDSTVSSSRCKR